MNTLESPDKLRPKKEKEIYIQIQIQKQIQIQRKAGALFRLNL